MVISLSDWVITSDSGPTNPSYLDDSLRASSSRQAPEKSGCPWAVNAGASSGSVTTASRRERPMLDIIYLHSLPPGRRVHVHIQPHRDHVGTFCPATRNGRAALNRSTFTSREMSSDTS